MLRLRLFRKGDLSSQIDSRQLEEGDLVVGRDAKAAWAIADPDKGISRRHLVIGNHGGLVTLRDTSSNGVFLGERRERVPQDRPVPIGRGEMIRFGDYVLVLEEDERASVPAPASIPVEAPFERSDRAMQPDAGARAERHPFASTLKADPFRLDGEVGSNDAWERRPDAPAGSWDAGARHQPEHNTLIGTDTPWVEPAPAAAPDGGFGFDAPFERPILDRAAPAAGATAIPNDWLDAAPVDGPGVQAGNIPSPRPAIAPTEPAPLPPAAAAQVNAPPPAEPSPAASPSPPEPVTASSPAPVAGASDDALFQHFCAGAGLNPQQFAGDDRAQVMERLGGVYRQAVVGIADLMRERTTLRNEYRMVHTAVQPEGNNPFKWVPPQRIAVELLRDEGGGYTTGERALNDALHDIKAHLLCMLAGMRAALSATFEALAPAQAEARLGARSYLMAVQRDAALWGEYVTIAEALRVEAEDNPDGLVNRAFRRGYEEQAAVIISDGRSWG